jgi:peptidyl-prolyl cis-trans isomerase SurA
MLNRYLLTALLCFGLVACNTSTQTLDTGSVQQQATADTLQNSENKSDSDESQQAEGKAADEQNRKFAANVIHKKPTVSRKGTYIRALVNGEPITNSDVQRRIRFMQLRRARGGEDAAIAELVDERLKIQEAARRSMLASQAQIDEAFANFAKNNRASVAQVSSELSRMGIGASHFKDFIKAQISWSRTLGSKIRAESRQESPGKAIFELRQSGEEKPETTEYQLQQIIFVVPEDKRRTLLNARRQEALNFKQRFSNCESTIELAKSLKDVSVKNLGRMMQPELPPGWKEAVSELEAGGITNPRETGNGIELVAVCSAKRVSDDKVVQILNQAKTFEALDENRGEAEGEEFLAELRTKATIVYK